MQRNSKLIINLNSCKNESMQTLALAFHYKRQNICNILKWLVFECTYMSHRLINMPAETSVMCFCTICKQNYSLCCKLIAHFMMYCCTGEWGICFTILDIDKSILYSVIHFVCVHSQLDNHHVYLKDKSSSVPVWILTYCESALGCSKLYMLACTNAHANLYAWNYI